MNEQTEQNKNIHSRLEEKLRSNQNLGYLPKQCARCGDYVHPFRIKKMVVDGVTRDLCPDCVKKSGRRWFNIFKK